MTGGIRKAIKRVGIYQIKNNNHVKNRKQQPNDR